MTTQIEKVSLTDPEAGGALARAAEIIRQGGLVVFPTETVYGLGADATNAQAAEKIYRAKGRPSDNPLIIHIAGPRDAETYAFTNSTYYLLAEHFMPGPLTVILPAKDTVPLTTRGGLPTVAVRCPSHPVANAFIRLCGVPVAAPSANLSGSPSPTNMEHVRDDMNGRVNMILDGGSSDFGLESTIVSIAQDGSLTLLRPGRITVEDLSALGLKVKIADAVTAKLKEGERALCPGMKYRHYAPRAPLLLLDGAPEKIAAYIRAQGKEKIAVLVFREDRELFARVLPQARLYEFGSRSDPMGQAHTLFFLLREADKENYDEIYAPLPGTTGVELALYNRMIRAAAYQIVRL